MISSSLLAADEPLPYRIINPKGSAPLLLVCDHASNRIPRCMGSLGLSEQTLSTHIAWDPGAAEVAEALSDYLDAPLVLSEYSRLIIDCNRPPTSPESIPLHSAGTLIPGNQNLSTLARQQRFEDLFMPYHHAIAQHIEQSLTAIKAIISIHSFTPTLNGKYRPWDIGIAYFQQPRLAQALYQSLQNQQLSICAAGPCLVGLNQPYAIESEFDFTIPTQGEARALHSAMIEIRQDGIPDINAARSWAQRITAAWHAAAAVINEPNAAR